MSSWLLDHGDYLLKPFNNQSSTRNSTQILVFICAVSIFVPLLFEPNAFAVGHNFQNISDEAIYGIVSNEYPREVMLSNFRYCIFEAFFNQGALPIVFSAFGEQKSPPESKDAPHKCKYKKMVEFQWAILSILVGCFIGNYLGSLYVPHY